MNPDIKLLIGAAFCLGAFAGIALLLTACAISASILSSQISRTEEARGKQDND
jgi:hypothetical protein